MAQLLADAPVETQDDAEEIRRRIRSYDQMYAQYQQQGKPFEALEVLERGLFLRKELYGPEHPEVGKVCQVFTTSCNTLAMNSLQRDNFMLAYELLKKAEILTAPGGYIPDKKIRSKLRAVTFNNFGCFYKRRGKLHAALQYLAKALKIELTSQEVDNPAGTHLNLCATLSQLKRHGPALEHAQCALQLLEAMPESKDKKQDGSSILAIAWHNLAVEQEHLNMMDAAIASYRQSVLVAEREWGANHIKTLAIKHSYEEALAKAKTRIQKRREVSGPSQGAGLLDGFLNPRRSPAKARGQGFGTGPQRRKPANQMGRGGVGRGSPGTGEREEEEEAWLAHHAGEVHGMGHSDQLPSIQGRETGSPGADSPEGDRGTTLPPIGDEHVRAGPRTPSPSERPRPKRRQPQG